MLPITGSSFASPLFAVFNPSGKFLPKKYTYPLLRSGGTICSVPVADLFV